MLVYPLGCWDWLIDELLYSIIQVYTFTLLYGWGFGSGRSAKDLFFNLFLLCLCILSGVEIDWLMNSSLPHYSSLHFYSRDFYAAEDVFAQPDPDLSSFSTTKFFSVFCYAASLSNVIALESNFALEVDRGPDQDPAIIRIQLRFPTMIWIRIH